jgi:hypothetical protein
MEPLTDAKTVRELAPLLTERQVAEQFNIPLNTLRYWRSIDAGPPFVKLERLVRYDVGALKRYLQRNTCGSAVRATATEER